MPLSRNTRVLNRYRVDGAPTKGGQASVYPGTDTGSGRAVVIKAMAMSPADARCRRQRERFETERQFRVHHPNVVDPLDSGVENNGCYIVFPRVGDMGLDEAHRHSGEEPDTKWCQKIITQIASGLGAFHKLGWAHRDLKPENIRLDSRTDQAWIIDAGTVRQFSQPNQGNEIGFTGTPLWCPPEQMLQPGWVDPRSDVYALGAIFYWLLTGAPPIQIPDQKDLSAQAANKQQLNPWPPRDLRPDLPQPTNQAILKSLAPEPGNRFGSVDDFARALSGQAPHGGTAPPSSPAPAPSSSPAQRCPHCGCHIGHQARYCTGCGSRVQAAGQRLVRCLGCGAHVDQGDRVCGGCGAVFAANVPSLQLDTGPLGGTRFLLPTGSYTVGRHELAPGDKYLSRRHLTVQCGGGRLVLSDAGAKNPTLIEGRPLGESAILPGQTVRLGASHGRFQ